MAIATKDSRDRQRTDRYWQALNTRILAPLAADERDIETQPALLEAERIRLGAIGLRDDLLLRGASWRDVHDAVVAWIAEQPTPVCDALGIELGLN